MQTSRIPATLAALLAGLVLLLAGASRLLVHCTRSDGTSRIELQRDAQDCHGRGPFGCRHQHGDAASPACCSHDLHVVPDPDPALPIARCGGGCDHVALTIELAAGPRGELHLPPTPTATPPPPRPPFVVPPQGRCEATPPSTGPPRPPGWLARRATVVLQL